MATRRYLDAPIGPITNELIVKASDLDVQGTEAIAGALLNLKQLRLERYGIKEIDNLELCSNLVGLHLQSNFIESIENVDFLPKLELLNLRNNRISKVDGLKRLMNLKILDLAENHISTMPNINEFPQELEYLWLNSNPICENEEKYRELMVELINNLPNLLQFDGMEIDREEYEEEEESENDTGVDYGTGLSVDAAKAMITMEASNAATELNAEREAMVERSRERRAKYMEDSMRRHKELDKAIESVVNDTPEAQQRRQDARDRYQEEYTALSSQDIDQPRQEMFTDLNDRLQRMTNMHASAVAEGTKIQGQTTAVLTAPTLIGIPPPLPEPVIDERTKPQAVPVVIPSVIPAAVCKKKTDSNSPRPRRPKDAAAPVGDVVLVRVGSVWVAKPREQKNSEVSDVLTRPYVPRAKAPKKVEKKANEKVELVIGGTSARRTPAATTVKAKIVPGQTPTPMKMKSSGLAFRRKK